jgi:protein-tyrosine-phosphatase
VTVIFVCTGNTCRSPLAEALARRMGAERGLDMTFASAGTGAVVGAPATDAAILVGLERGVDLSRHRSRPFAASNIGSDTIVLAMSSGHVSGIRAVAPNVRVFLLDEYASHGSSHRSVADPFGGDLEEYRRAADEIEAMLAPALDRLAAEHAAGSP